MSGRRRSFTPEYRVEAAHRVIDGNRPVAEVALELNLHENLLHKWVADERRPIFTSDSSPRWCLEHPEPQRGHVDAVVEGDGFHGVQLRWVRWREQDGPQSCGGQRR